MTEIWCDGSRYQGEPNFSLATDVVGWIWNIDDPNWREKVQRAYAAGKKVGLYRWLYPNENPADAAHALLIARDNAGVPITALAIDHEEGFGDQTLRVCEAMRVLTLGTGPAVPLLYTGGWYATAHYINHALWPELSKYLLWDAAYTPIEPAPPAPWNYIAVWQYSSSVSIPGVSGNVDASRVFISMGPQTGPLVPTVGSGIAAISIIGVGGMVVWDDMSKQYHTVWIGTDGACWHGWATSLVDLQQAKNVESLGGACVANSASIGLSPWEQIVEVTGVDGMIYRQWFIRNVGKWSGGWQSQSNSKVMLPSAPMPVLQSHTHTISGTTGATTS